ncbi:hypothetical protein ACN4EG_05130 [Alkalinema pantanalense CENA528]|uniref:hypothetical protein n=1 Tax=Alkalinema pantanalense TaxID=1620705 RepID=UPI003D6EE82B
MGSQLFPNAPSLLPTLKIHSTVLPEEQSLVELQVISIFRPIEARIKNWFERFPVSDIALAGNAFT